MRFLNPPKEELPDDFSMPVWDHLDELRERVLVGGLAAAVAVLTCFCFSKELVVFLELPVISQVRRLPPPLVRLPGTSMLQVRLVLRRCICSSS
jgi:Sec-independent protein secretion pathway component TatC